MFIRRIFPKSPQVRRQVYCLILFVFFSIAFIVSGVAVGYGLRVRNFDGTDEDAGVTPPVGRTVYLESELLSVDPVASNMVMNWYIIDDSCFFKDSNEACTPVGLYFDTNLLRLDGDDANSQLANRPPQDPIFTWYPEELDDIFANSAVFRTTSLLFNNNKQSRKLDASPQNYPFDTYGANVFVFANDTTTNSTVNVDVNWATGIAVGFKTKSNITLSEEGFYQNFVTLSRSKLIKSYVMCIVIGTWLVTLIFVGSVMKVMFGYKQPKEALAVPIATLFAFTSLRGTMPGAPTGFGAVVDFVGILPCLAIITLAGVILFGFMVISDGEVSKAEPAILPARLYSPNSLEKGTLGVADIEPESARKPLQTSDSVGTFHEQRGLVYEPLRLEQPPGSRAD